MPPPFHCPSPRPRKSVADAVYCDKMESEKLTDRRHSRASASPSSLSWQTRLGRARSPLECSAPSCLPAIAAHRATIARAWQPQIAQTAASRPHHTARQSALKYPVFFAHLIKSRGTAFRHAWTKACTPYTSRFVPNDRPATFPRSLSQHPGTHPNGWAVAQLSDPILELFEIHFAIIIYIAVSRTSSSIIIYHHLSCHQLSECHAQRDESQGYQGAGVQTCVYQRAKMSSSS